MSSFRVPGGAKPEEVAALEEKLADARKALEAAALGALALGKGCAAQAPVQGVSYRAACEYDEEIIGVPIAVGLLVPLVESLVNPPLASPRRR